MQPTISTLELRQLASGDTLSLQVYKFRGKQPGKKAYLQANLHGAEIVGNAVIYQLIEFFTALDINQLWGEVWLVPLCNPSSSNERGHFFSTGRFNHYDGKDWNRIFWDYEKECEDLEEFAQSCLHLTDTEIYKQYLHKITTSFQKQLVEINNYSSAAYYERYRFILQSLCLDANYILDLHSSSNQGINYLFCFQSREESAKYFGLDYGILMNEYDGEAFDEAMIKPWLALEKQLAKLGKQIKFDLESWTLELGSGMQINPESVTKGVAGIKSYLTYKGMLLENPQAVIETDINLVKKSNLKKYFATTGGMIQNRLPLGNFVEEKETLYQILNFNKKAALPTLIDICAEKAGLIFDISTNEGVNQGEYILSIMEGVRQN